MVQAEPFHKQEVLLVQAFAFGMERHMNISELHELFGCCSGGYNCSLRCDVSELLPLFMLPKKAVTAFLFGSFARAKFRSTKIYRYLYADPLLVRGHLELTVGLLCFRPSSAHAGCRCGLRPHRASRLPQLHRHHA